MVALRFTRFEVESAGSLAVYLAHLESRTGIYWLTFDDGSEYVGQAVEVVRRVATHRRKQAGTIIELAFAPVPREDLDGAERWFIARREATGASLRNKMLTRRPGGLGEGTVEVHPGVSVTLPWDRDQRGRIASGPAGGLDGTVAETPRMPVRPVTASQRKQWERLQTDPAWPQVRAFLRHFVRETMSSPHLTAGGLWTVSALPNTARMPGWYRLCTLNVGRIEAVYIGRDAGQGVVVCWNIEPYDRYTDLPGQVRALAVRQRFARKPVAPVEITTHHAYADPVCALHICGAEVADKLLSVPAMADLAYRFNTRYQRQGMTFQRRGHNSLFAADLLAPE